MVFNPRLPPDAAVDGLFKKIMKYRLLVILLLICSSISAQIIRSDDGVPFSQNRSDEIFIDGMWKFLLCHDEIPAGFQEEGYNDSGWDEIPVPGCWDALGLIKPRYTSPEDVQGLYRTSFNIPESWKKEHVFIRFDGVLRGYEFWINGEYAGKWESAYNSRQFDITPYIRQGENLLAVRVYKNYKGTGFDSNDDWGQIGIHRSVSVFSVPDFHLCEMNITTENVSQESADVKINATLATFGLIKSRRNGVNIKITDPSGKTVFSWKDRFETDSISIIKEIRLQHPDLWTAETPSLYTLELTADSGENERIRFGIREVSIHKEQLMINGRPIKLRGVNHHDTEPFDGKRISRESLLRDMEMMKEANINFIRCSHYPKSPEFYDLCDSLGFYVMDEVPFGFGDEHLDNPEYQEILLNRAHATVMRDRNHPSVIIWSIGNENPLTEIAKETGRFVKKIDPTRPICYPMIHNYFLSLDFKIPEFIDIYAPHYPTVPTLEYYAASAERPVILTEYCHTLGQSLEQHDQLWDIIEANSNLAGGAVWEWSDQGMVDRTALYPGKFRYTQDVWTKDSTCIIMNGNSGTDGLVYAERTPLSNYYEVRRNYAQARLLTESLTGHAGENVFTLEIENRYDFIDLDDAVSFSWQLYDGRTQASQGEFKISCPAREIRPINICTKLDDDPAFRCYTIKIQARDKSGRCIGDYSIPIRSTDGLIAQEILSGAKNDTCTELADHEIMLRVGRKKGLAEKIQARNSVGNYLIRPVWGEKTTLKDTVIQYVSYNNPEFAGRGAIRYYKQEKGGLHIEASVTPEGDNRLLLEAGFTFLLDKDIRYFQWIGNGPYATYPGKSSANSYGCHSMAAGDLYFEGNRMGIDALLCTDINGKGILFICNDGMINLEETDSGVTVSFNDEVSGICGKLRKTAFPIYSEDIESIDISVTMCAFDLDSCTETVRNLFSDPSSIIINNPFMTQYDTFLLSMDEILGNTNGEK